MTGQRVGRLAALFVLALALGACSSDDDGGGGGSGGDDDTFAPDITTTSDVADDDISLSDTAEPDDAGEDTMGTLDTTGVDIAIGEDAGPDIVDTTEPDTFVPTAQCSNQADTDAIAAVDFFGIIVSCASSCAGQPAGCAAECVQTQSGVSSGCASCGGATTECAATACGLTCVGSTQVECFNCVNSSCGSAFTTCSGIVLPGIPDCSPDCDGKECGSDGCNGVCGLCSGSICQEGLCEEVPEDACANTDDEAAISADDPVTKANDCGLQCIINPDPLGCVNACLLSSTSLSAGCSYCFGSQQVCSGTNCLFDCFDATSAACLACEAANCNSGFTECAGSTFPGALEPGACDNSADSAAFDATDTKAVMSGCLVTCSEEGDQAACLGTCYESEAFSTDCTGCIVDASACILTSCADSCSDGFDSPACAVCAAENCNTGFQTCAGANLTDLFPCSPVCDGKSCGLDGCGGSCGTCLDATICVDGACEALDNAWCSNSADTTVLSGTEPAQAAQDCSLTCLGDAEFAGCIGACTTDGTGLSEPCALCFGLETACAYDQCLTQCSTDPSAAACTDCLSTNCAAGFEACSGLTFTDYYGN